MTRLQFYVEVASFEGKNCIFQNARPRMDPACATSERGVVVGLLDPPASTHINNSITKKPINCGAGAFHGFLP